MNSMIAAMTDGQFWMWTIVGCLTLAFTLALFAAGLAKAAGRPAPKPPTLADRMENARWDRSAT